MDFERIPKLVVVGFAQYKNKIEYVYKWCKKVADITDYYCHAILEEVPGKSQMILIFKCFKTAAKGVIIEYDKADEALALQQIAVLLCAPGQLIGMDIEEFLSVFSSKMKCLTYAIHINEKEDADDVEKYLIAAQEWLSQIAPNYNFNNNSAILFYGDVGLISTNEIATFYADKIMGKDNSLIWQAIYDERLASNNTMQMTIWLNETDN